MPLKPLGGILPYFGSKRMLAPQIVEQFGSHKMYFEVFGGSLAVLLAKPECQLEVVSEKNSDVANLIRCLADDGLAQQLWRWAGCGPVSETLFTEAASRLSDPWDYPDDHYDVHRAFNFLLVSWQGPSGLAGTTRKPRFAIRNTVSGGSLAARWQAVAPAIPLWHERLRNIEFRCKDAFELLESVPDQKDVVIYSDSPYLAEARTGGEYLCDFTPDDHERLWGKLNSFEKARVVVSYSDHPKLDELYNVRYGWRKIHLKADRTMKHSLGGEQEKVTAGEVLFINQ